jgi:hypothetical protein
MCEAVRLAARRPNHLRPVTDKENHGCLGAAMNGLSKRDWLVIAPFAFVTLGTALVILNWIMGWY